MSISRQEFEHARAGSLCSRGCKTPLEHRLHVLEPILGSKHFQREALALTKRILRPVAKVLTAFANSPTPKKP